MLPAEGSPRRLNGYPAYSFGYGNSFFLGLDSNIASDEKQFAWIKSQIANPGTKATYRAESMKAERKGHMPRFDDKLEGDDLNLLAVWVRKKARGDK